MRIIISLQLIFLSSFLYAQEEAPSPALRDIIVDSAFYIPQQQYRAFGMSYQTSRDRALSPLIFQGPGYSFRSSSWTYKDQWLWQSGFVTRLYLMENAPSASQLSEFANSFEYVAMRELTQLQKRQWRFWLGPEARMLLNTRLHSRNVNNVASYDWATSLGVSAMISNKFELWGRRFALSNQFQLPLAFVYARPPYAWGIPPGIFEEEKGAWIEAFQLGTLNDILFMRNQLNLDFYLRTRKKKQTVAYRAYRISYSWEFFQVKTRNHLQSGGHELTFSRALTL